MTKLVALYVDLYDLQLRALTDAEATEWGVKLVPSALRAKVQAVVDGRQTA